MMTMDVPEPPAPTPQAVLVAQAPQAAIQTTGRVARVCRAIDYRPELGEGEGYWEESGGGLGPESVARTYLVRYENRTDIYPTLDGVEVLTQPQHGIVKLGTSGGGDPQYNYIPELNYIGTDKVDFRVNTAAGPVVVQYYIVVTNKGSESKAAERLCDKASKRPNSWKVWRISSSIRTPTFGSAKLQALLGAVGSSD